MINLITGKLGGGKSMYSVRKGVRALQHGKLWVTNFKLSEEFFDVVANHTWRMRSKEYREAKAWALFNRYRYIETFDELTQLRVRAEKPYARKLGGNKWVVKEHSCLVSLDEVHRWMNARSWAKKDQKRGEILEWMALSRHYGIDVDLITQRDKNIDVQVRELFENLIVIKNLRYSARVLGLRVCPFDIFIAGWFNAHEDKKRAQRTDRFRRKRWVSNLYDSMDLGSFGKKLEDMDMLADREVPRLWVPERPEHGEAATEAAKGAGDARRAPQEPVLAGGAPVACPGLVSPGQDFSPEQVFDPSQARPGLDPSL